MGQSLALWVGIPGPTPISTMSTAPKQSQVLCSSVPHAEGLLQWQLRRSRKTGYSQSQILQTAAGFAPLLPIPNDASIPGHWWVVTPQLSPFAHHRFRGSCLLLHSLGA